MEKTCNICKSTIKTGSICGPCTTKIIISCNGC